MRPLYFIVKNCLQMSLGILFKNKITLNNQKKFRTPTIYICNHPSAFLDPLVIAGYGNSIIHFMVRADVFNKFTIPIFNDVHMIPIYREQDGGKEALEKNEASFKRAEEFLYRRKGLIVFGEGFTDDVFIRRLKPLKKGAARIAIGTMERYNWDFDLKIQCIGINYSNPNVIRGDVVLSYSDIIHVKDFKEIYDDNPNKAINQIQRLALKELKAQITHVQEEKIAAFHEMIMRLTRKGMNAEDTDRSIPLEERFRYSQNLANFINTIKIDENEEWVSVKEDTEAYFKAIEDKEIAADNIVEYTQKGKVSVLKDWIQFIACIPFIPFALIHAAFPYYFVKNFVEKKFKRKVFWGGVKMVMGFILMGLYNIPFIFLFYHLIYADVLFAIAYFIMIPPLSGIIAYKFLTLKKKIKVKNRFKGLSSEFKNELKTKRQSILDRLEKLGVEV